MVAVTSRRCQVYPYACLPNAMRGYGDHCVSILMDLLPGDVSLMMQKYLSKVALHILSLSLYNPYGTLVFQTRLCGHVQYEFVYVFLETQRASVYDGEYEGDGQCRCPCLIGCIFGIQIPKSAV